MRKRLFDDNDRYNSDGERLAGLTDSLIANIVEAWARDGFSVRDIESVMTRSVSDACLDKILENS